MERFAHILMFVLCGLGAAEHSALHIGLVGTVALVCGAVIAFVLYGAPQSNNYVSSDAVDKELRKIEEVSEELEHQRASSIH